MIADCLQLIAANFAITSEAFLDFLRRYCFLKDLQVVKSLSVCV